MTWETDMENGNHFHDKNRIDERSLYMSYSPYVLRKIPPSGILQDYSDLIVKDAVGMYRRGTKGMPVYEPPAGHHAGGLSISIGRAISRAGKTIPHIGGTADAVIFPKATYDHRNRWVVAVHERYGPWGFPNPGAYGANLADELRDELLWEIGLSPTDLDFTGLKHFLDKVLPRPEYAGTDDPAVRRALLHRVIDLGLDAEE